MSPKNLQVEKLISFFNDNILLACPEFDFTVEIYIAFADSEFYVSILQHSYPLSFAFPLLTCLQTTVAYGVFSNIGKGQLTFWVVL